MTEAERQSLEEVRREISGVRRSLSDLLERRPMESDAGLALERLETTYMLRLYATFEGLLRTRLSATVADSEGLVNLVQRVAQEGLAYDPATTRQLT